MKVIGAYWLGFGLVFAASMIAHDIFVFAEVRDRIDAAIQDLRPSEIQPNGLVREVFRLDTDCLYFGEAFSIYRDEFLRRRWGEHAYFHSHKIPASLTWAMALWVSYGRTSIEAFRLRRLGAEQISIVVYRKGLNDLDARQLKCVFRFAQRPSHPRACPEVAPLRYQARGNSPQSR